MSLWVSEYPMRFKLGVPGNGHHVTPRRFRLHCNIELFKEHNCYVSRGDIGV